MDVLYVHLFLVLTGSDVVSTFEKLYLFLFCAYLHKKVSKVTDPGTHAIFLTPVWPG